MGACFSAPDPPLSGEELQQALVGACARGDAARVRELLAEAGAAGAARGVLRRSVSVSAAACTSSAISLAAIERWRSERTCTATHPESTMWCQRSGDHDEHRDADEVVAYLKRWLLVDDTRARQMLKFLSSPLWRAYTSTYVEGYRLLRAWLDARHDGVGLTERFGRLLDEPLIPSSLRAEVA
jgi:hypothetical protein